jgi:pimeloyl-ACP methyl ester carboxylesterase
VGTSSALTRTRHLAGRATRAAARRPAILLGPLELHRAGAETALLFASLPPLVARPRPDEHPVLVVPGLSGGSRWCAVLRQYLSVLGHRVHEPEPGATKGRPGTVAERLERQVTSLARRHETSVSIVGWSVGGAFVRQVALAVPDQVRQVVTLGAPSGGLWYAERPGSADQPMPVPTTSIYSRSDPWFDWRECLQPASPRCEDVAIPSSHLGMATNAFAYHVIADRLAQPAGQWSPYQPPRWSPVVAAPSSGAAR